MIPSLIITFRETLEAALVVSIILAYLVKTNQLDLRRIVWFGVTAGIAGSIVAKFAFDALAGGFTGRAEEMFEGITMLIGAALLATLIVWMARQRNVAEQIESNVAVHLHRAGAVGLFLLVFVSIIREGVETVIFLGAADMASESGSLPGAILGIVLALIAGYALAVGAGRLPLRKFFDVSSVLLILFAAGLVAHGIHELQEAGTVPIVSEHFFDINPPANPDGSYPLLHENGAIGGIPILLARVPPPLLS